MLQIICLFLFDILTIQYDYDKQGSYASRDSKDFRHFGARNFVKYWSLYRTVARSEL